MTLVREFDLFLTAGRGLPLLINVNQFDSGEEWHFTLYKGDGTQYIPSTGAIVGIKSDGLGIINSGTVVDGKVVIVETQQMTAAVGKATFELTIDSGTHGTANFHVLVEPKPGNNADLSDSDISLIQEALNAVNPLPTGGTVGQVLTKTAQGSAWSDAGTPTQEQVAEAVSDWADEHITVETGVVIDTSLSVAGAAADAKKTGDEISDLKSAIQQNASDISTEETRAKAEEERLEALFTAPTQEAVDNWLDTHPEATTTVQDASLTEVKFTDALKLKTIKDYVTPEMYGAKGDGETNDRQAILDAFASAYETGKGLYFPQKTYYSNSEIVIENVPDNVIMDGMILFAVGNGLTLGVASQQMWYKHLKINVTSNTQDGLVDYFGLKLINCANCDVFIDYVNQFNTGVVLVGDSKAFAYNTFKINYIRSISTSMKIIRDNSGYNNENLFIGGRFIETDGANGIGILVTGNGHTFLKPSIENTNKCFVFAVGSRNTVIGCRGENSTYGADFDADSYLNNVDFGYGVPQIIDATGMNAIGVNSLESARGVDTVTARSYTNTVFDSGNLIEKVDLTDPDDAVLSEPLVITSSTGNLLRTAPTSLFTTNGNELKLSNRLLGVMVDCSIAKQFLIEQGGSGTNSVAVKLYDANGALIDMTDINIGLGSRYASSFGGHILGYDKPASYVVLPTAAKKAFIGVKGASGLSLFRLVIKSRSMSSVITNV